MTAGDFLCLHGVGSVTFAASCTGGTAKVQGAFARINNGTIVPAYDDNTTNIDATKVDTSAILIDTDVTIPGLINGLNDISVVDILTTQMTEAYAADGVAPTLAQALFLIQQELGDFSIAGTTITVKKLDGTTTAATFTLDDGTDPTSRTRTT